MTSPPPGTNAIAATAFKVRSVLTLIASPATELKTSFPSETSEYADIATFPAVVPSSVAETPNANSSSDSSQSKTLFA